MTNLCVGLDNTARGWEAWIHNAPLVDHLTACQPTREAAVADLKAQLAGRLADLAARGGRNPYPATVDALALRWFDPARDYRYCDTTFYRGEVYTFLRYDDEGAAVVVDVAGRSITANPADLKPCGLNHSW